MCADHLSPRRKRSWLGACLWVACLVPMGLSVACAQTLVLGAANSIPTAYVENGKQSGMLVDVSNEAFQRAGYPIQIALMPWARCLAEVKAGKIDGIFSAYRTREREEFLTYSDEVLITQVQALFVRKESTISFDGDLKKISDLRIGVINETSYGPRLDEELRQGTFKKVDTTDSASSNIRKLLQDRIDVIPSYRHVALDSARTLGVAGSIKELSPSIESIPSYLAFSNKKDHRKIARAFDQALRSMKKDGTYDAIFNKYLAGSGVRQ